MAALGFLPGAAVCRRGGGVRAAGLGVESAKTAFSAWKIRVFRTRVKNSAPLKAVRISKRIAQESHGASQRHFNRRSASLARSGSQAPSLSAQTLRSSAARRLPPAEGGGRRRSEIDAQPRRNGMDRLVVRHHRRHVAAVQLPDFALGGRRQSERVNRSWQRFRPSRRREAQCAGGVGLAHPEPVWCVGRDPRCGEAQSRAPPDRAGLQPVLRSEVEPRFSTAVTPGQRRYFGA